MPDGRRRSREGWADAMEAGPPATASHTHRLPKAVRLAFIGLVAAVFLVLIGLGLMAVQVYKANQYVQGRGEFRDAEAARMEAESSERIRQAMCDLLDQLPEGGLLERPRAKYDCGPGIPVAELTPDEQAQLNGRARPQVAPSTPPPPASPDASPMGGAVTEPPRAPAAQPPGPAEPTPVQPPPDSGPVVDGNPVTALVCGLASICPKE